MSKAFDNAMEVLNREAERLMNADRMDEAFELNGVIDRISGEDYLEGKHTAAEWNKGYEIHYMNGFDSRTHWFRQRDTHRINLSLTPKPGPDD